MKGKFSSRILIVEDNPQNAKLVKLWLAADGYNEAELAANGEEGLAKALASPPDLVILDAMMPGKNGFEVAQALKGDTRTCSVPVIMLTALADHDSRLRALEAGVEEFLTKPIERSELRARVRNLLRLKAYSDILADANRLLEAKVEERTFQLCESHREAIFTLSRAAEHRDEDTGDHILRVGRYAVALGRVLKADEAYLERLIYATMMHDLGKIGIPDQILLKPGPLTQEEWEVMKRHPEVGHQILQDTASPYLSMGAEIALFHHERWDGSGYPRGAAGEEIPLSARIMGICDQYDALRSHRPYKPHFSHERTLGILTEGDGRTRPEHFDPAVLAAFTCCAEEFDRIWLSDGGEGRAGELDGQNTGG